jgi:thiol-disulfide isomerase/thioredoxin
LITQSLRFALYTAVALIAFGAGLWISSQGQSNATTTAAAAQNLLALNLPDLKNQRQSLSQWRGKVLVVNFWATWCAPCREEIPIFVRLQDLYRDKGLQFVGISIDKVDKTSEFAATYKMNYPNLIGTFDTVELSRTVGNSKRVLPFTVIIDRKGQIVTTEQGGLKQEKLESLLKSLL